MDQGQRARGDGRAGMSVVTRETAAHPRRRSLPASAGWIAFGALALVAFAGLLYSGARRLLLRRVGLGPGPSRVERGALLEPHNEHLSLVPVLGLQAAVLDRRHGLLRAVPVAGLRCTARRGAAVRLRAPRVGDAARARRGGGRAVPRHRRGPTCCGRSRSASSARSPRDRSAARARPRGPPRRRDRRGAARRRARVVLARAAAAGGLGARGARAPGPALALVDRRRSRRPLRASGTSPTAARDGDLGQPVRPRPATSPTRRRAPRARCSRSTWTGAARSPWWASSRC